MSYSLGIDESDTSEHETLMVLSLLIGDSTNNPVVVESRCFADLVTNLIGTDKIALECDFF